MSAIEKVPENVRQTIYDTVNLMGPFGSQKQGHDLAEAFARYYLQEYGKLPPAPVVIYNYPHQPK